MASSSATLVGSTASDLLRSSTTGFTGVPLRTLGRAGLVLKRRDLTVSVTAKLRKVKRREYPWSSNPDPNMKGGRLRHLSTFQPLKQPPKPVILEFEKPLINMEKKINDFRKVAEKTGVDLSDQILALEAKYQKALVELYTNLTPIQRVTVARHPNRPTFLDHMYNMTEKFVELHGDREGYDDPAIAAGLGSIDGKTYMFIGHQKGRDTKENIKRNFAMPTPHGYRKALRLMEYADHHGFPIVTFIDTPGAFADLKSEQLGQGEAIAHNLRSMFALKVPVISIVIGEGGSGGALAIGCANKLLMLENSVFFVASPEACGAILWKSNKAAPKAAERLKITASALLDLEIADGIIPEPLAGAHTDPSWMSQQIKIAINEAMDELTKLSTEDLIKDRMHKFRKLGVDGIQEGIPLVPSKKVNTKKREIGVPPKRQEVPIPDSQIEAEIEKLKKAILEGEDSSAAKKNPGSQIGSAIDKLKGLFLEGKDSSAAKKTPGSQIVAELDKLKGLYLEAKDSSAAKVPGSQIVAEIEKLKNSIFEDEDSSSAVLPEKIPGSEIAVEIAKLKKNILEGKDSSSEPSKLDLDKTIETLKREVNREFSEAVKAAGLTKTLTKLRGEISKAKAGNQPLTPLLKEEIKSFNQRLSAAPNSRKLLKKRGLLREVTKVKLLLDKNKAATRKQELKKKSDEHKEAARLEQELKKKFDEVMDTPRIKEKYEALRSEVRRVDASSGSGLDDELKKKIIEFNKEVDLELATAVKSVGLEVESVKPGHGWNKSSVPEIEELNKDVQKEIEIVANSSPNVKRLIEQLKLEVAKSGGKPDSESKSRIDALTQQIKKSLAEAVDSPSLKEKYENLTRPAGDTLTDDKLREKVGVNRNFS
ncbi:unnamed protein product [Lathyrus oleraceus]|uniref:acetyl-CoA carboxytransferase n=1 Tax=Pisum sativum TaxID=3888 RepID=A0A9D4Y0U6_PEA|nr:acetyl-coenzyme A carboxylase carboxyl transferase subunit alpha, chloroplastic [Pisum sativum]KAI5429619.1 hypothetical protein KIW84_034266 [Pisum sativum]